jgi:predicted nuclease of restriction endonuclease-like RecB superfamily
MLLPLDRLAFDVVHDRVVPRWLGAADEPFVAAVLDAIGSLAGLSARDAELAGDRLLGDLAKQRGVPKRVASCIWAIERRRWDALVDAPVVPSLLRDVVFELAARLPRDQALEEAARQLGIPSALVVGCLFADRPSRRVLHRPAERSRVADLVARYNLVALQSLLARSMEVRAFTADEAPLALASAKQCGVFVELSASNGGIAMVLEGPVGEPRHRAKYGRSMARIVPALVASPGWTLAARVMLRTKSAELRLEGDGAVAFPKGAPVLPDVRLARRVARVLRTVGVRVDRQPAVSRVGGTLVVPDFALEWSGRRVLVDVVPFATADYLARKREVVERLGRPMLVCVDDRYAFFTAPWLVAYRTELDPWVLWGTAQRLLQTFGSSFDLANEAMAE